MEVFQNVQVNLMALLVGVIMALVVGYLLGYFLRKIFTDFQIKEAEALSEKIIKAAFAFLLEREPLTKIKTKFDCSIIRRLFPEVDAELPGMI